MVRSVGHGIGSAVLLTRACTSPGRVIPRLSSNATTPATCGDAIEVPWSQQYVAVGTLGSVVPSDPQSGRYVGHVDSTRPWPGSAVCWNLRSPPGAMTWVTPTP